MAQHKIGETPTSVGHDLSHFDEPTFDEPTKAGFEPDCRQFQQRLKRGFTAQNRSGLTDECYHQSQRD